jgi:hypothetical protein
MRALALLLLFCFSAGAEESADGPRRIFRDPFIEQLAGDWQLKRQIRGREVENTVTAEWVLNHQFLQLHMKDVAVPHWIDVFGGKFSAIGHGKRSGDTFKWDAAAQGWTFTMESVGKDGKRQLFAVDTLRRRK